MSRILVIRVRMSVRPPDRGKQALPAHGELPDDVEEITGCQLRSLGLTVRAAFGREQAVKLGEELKE